ncbi:MAG: tetratricopeptide repeat protein [Chloroflexota bacterium]
MELSGLSTGDIRQMVEDADISPYWLRILNLQKLTQLHEATLGNPYLLELSLTLMEIGGQSLDELLEELQQSPSVEFILKRIQERLPEAEWQLLQFLSVFIGQIPMKPILTETNRDMFVRLQERRLLQFDTQEAVRLQPTYREAIAGTLTNVGRKAYHEQAALIRQQYNENTSALYHLIEANAYDHAVQLWYMYSPHEITQGQSGVALELLKRIPKESLTQTNREQLTLMRCYLYQLFGRDDEILTDLDSTDWQTDAHAAEAQAMRGYIQLQRSDFGGAAFAYGRAIEIAERDIDTINGDHLAFYYKQLALVSVQDDETEKAWEAALKIEYEMEQTKGMVQARMNNLPRALAHYQAALALADQLQHIHGQAKTCKNIGNIYSRQGMVELAADYYERASQYYQAMGHQVALAGVQQNYANMYVIAEQYEQALPYAERALSLFEQFQNQYGVMITRQSLAEIYVQLGQLDKAEENVKWGFQAETPSFTCNAQRTLGEIRLQQGRFKDANKYVSESLQTAEEYSLDELAAYSHKVMGDIHVAQREIDNARHSFEEAKALFDQLEVRHKVAVIEMILDGLA